MLFSQKTDQGTINLKQGLIDLLEGQAENSGSNQNYYELGEKIDYLLKHPLDINKATYSDFLNCLIFTESEIKAILHYRDMYHQFVAIDELKATNAFSEIKLKRIKPLVTISPVNTPENNFSHHQLLMRSQWKTNTIDDYLGPNYGLLTKYQFSSQKVSTGFTVEKDIGEPYNDKLIPYNYFDFNSAFIELNDPVKPVSKFIAGDYSLKVEQGLVFWNSYAFGGSFYDIDMGRSAPTLSSYRSVNEHNFLRGAAVEITLKEFSLIPFISFKNLNATSYDDTTFTTIYEDGIHRTENELKRKASAKELTTGITANWSKKYFVLGFTSAYSKYSKLYTPTFLEESKIENTHLSINYKVFFRNFTFNGETATRNISSLASIHNLNFKPDARLEFHLSHRYYSPTYYSVYENAYKNSTRANNENGFYMGMNYFFTGELSVTLFSDWYTNITNNPTKVYPEKGNKKGVQLKYTKGEHSIFYVRWTSKDSEGYSGSLDQKKFISVDENKQTLRVDYTHLFNETIKLRTRVEYAEYEKGKEDGFLLFQDFYHRLSYKFKYNFRVAYFTTSSFDAAIYAYESDVLYAFNTTSYFDKGTKYYLNVGYSIGKHWDFWVRAATTRKPKYYATLYDNNIEQLWELKFQLLLSY